MKKVLLMMVGVSMLTVALVFAHGKDVTLKGTLIDNMCAGKHKDDIAAEIKTHPKTCLLKESCAKTGYSLYSDGKIYHIAKQSQSKVQDFLKEAKNDIQVSVEGDLKDGTIAVEEIENITKETAKK